MKCSIKKWLVFLVWLSAISVSLNGWTADPTAQDAEIESRLKALSQELRCLVCQNTTLADSNAPLAEDLRNEIRVQMRQGKTDEQVTAYLVERYGDFVRYKPPVNSNTLLLWFGPFLMLLIGAISLFVVLRKNASRQDADSGNDNLETGAEE